MKIILIAFGVTVFVFAAASAAFVYSELSKISAPEKVKKIERENEVFDTEGSSEYGTELPQFEPEDICMADWQ